MTEQDAEPCSEAAWFGDRARWPWNSSLPSPERGSCAGDELPRKTRPSTLTGRKNVRREEIQLA